MSVVVVPTGIGLPIAAAKYARNGAYPNSEFQSALSLTADRVLAFRPKHLATFFQPFPDLTRASGAPTVYWRFAFRTHAFARYVFAQFYLAQPDNGAATDPYAELKIETSVPATVGTAQAHQASNTGGVTDVPANYTTSVQLVKHGTPRIPSVLTASTDLFATIQAYNGACIVGCSVWMTAKAPDTSNGYAQVNFAGGSPIYDEDRLDVTTITRGMWKEGGGQIFNWSSRRDSEAITNSTTSNINILDNTSTTYTGAIPGPAADLSNRSTVRRAGTVPVKVWVYASRTVSDGAVDIRDNTGHSFITVSVTGAAGWYSATGDFDASSSKFYVTYTAGAAGTITLYAVSIMQHEDP